MTRSTWITRLLVAAVVAAGTGAGSAQAGLLPVSVSVTPEAGNFRWQYSLVLPSNMQLQSGNYFTIYDFKGYVPGNESAPDDWTLTTGNVGTTPDNLTPDDDAGVVNLTWTYTGNGLNDAGLPIIGENGLGNFWAYSQLGGGVSGDFFAAESNRASDGLFVRSVTPTMVPSGDVPPPIDAPEPATLLMAGVGLPLAGLVRRFRRK